jgi:hypothetical protein
MSGNFLIVFGSEQVTQREFMRTQRFTLKTVTNDYLFKIRS